MTADSFNPLTEEEVKAGRALDALVAEKVMGLENVRHARFAEGNDLNFTFSAPNLRRKLESIASAEPSTRPRSGGQPKGETKK